MEGRRLGGGLVVAGIDDGDGGDAEKGAAWGVVLEASGGDSSGVAMKTGTGNAVDTTLEALVAVGRAGARRRPRLRSGVEGDDDGERVAISGGTRGALGLGFRCRAAVRDL